MSLKTPSPLVVFQVEINGNEQMLTAARTLALAGAGQINENDSRNERLVFFVNARRRKFVDTVIRKFCDRNDAKMSVREFDFLPSSNSELSAESA
ncbi:hypothetical protein JW758_05465 [Candidatus Peregrinibacteria bacterium]|nr:hypothetical protein [Candidatus Peregrinibacteria bacterium]